MRKKFPCGHQGRGKYCHRCAQHNKEQQQAEHEKVKQRSERHEWRASFKKDLIDLTPLDSHGKNLVLKARKIISSIQNGTAYTDYSGKRLNYNRKIISIPINRDYRLIVHDTLDGLQIKKLMSHEAYNRRKPGEP